MDGGSDLLDAVEKIEGGRVEDHVLPARVEPIGPVGSTHIAGRCAALGALQFLSGPPVHSLEGHRLAAAQTPSAWLRALGDVGDRLGCFAAVSGRCHAAWSAPPG